MTTVMGIATIMLRKRKRGEEMNEMGVGEKIRDRDREEDGSMDRGSATHTIRLRQSILWRGKKG
jgi:hypothetical protein